jgi:uncharacterized protein
MQLAYPYRIDGSGRTAQDETRHIRDMIEQVLFTAPGERVNRPDFGSGLLELLFAPESDELVAATQFMVQGALQRWLGDLIQVEAVQVARDESALHITVQYIELRTRQRHLATLKRD